MVWYGKVWYGMVWHDMVWYGMAWHAMVWHGVVWYESKSPRGGGVLKKFNRGRLRPRSDPLPFYIPFWAEKVPLSYTFHWKIREGPLEK